MPVLGNTRHERFAQEVASGSSQSEAYATAGFRSETPAATKANASRLMSRPEVRERVAELQLAQGRQSEIKRADIIEMLLADRERAHAQRQIAAAVRAAELIGKLCGMFIDRREVRTVNPLDDLDYEELVALRAFMEAAKAQQAS
jgi:hypothetical protein